MSKKLQDYLIEFINLENGKEFIVKDEDCETLRKLLLIFLALGQKEIEFKDCSQLSVKKRI
ncbi:hypothetical protein BFU36_10985 [Sulfolobus sp. A20]|nr:hypothetical protein BFU36_10985 [Sulfolobus sp. A20]TRM74511.1 hypothetical protein DJ532_12680 [Sulfolobus sp. A20-N-F8]TRM78232.1 hypothetical protein DJ528_05215 [Sulfolobus sp. B5]TRM80129.1 hypothetical protein DJ524_08580 [Sulfolobus sp. D5]TRM80136.1 hypothetical protein DJ531_12665 [Sulfolobus sp. A20-N-F6]TRM86680.1 hypothetical protein DJ521_05050 [Sulfolobus sp. E3]TRM89078.1 hypothetical protein DJ529_03165 [Sulfolobus sp. C3]TRM94514.1 hypothetical protein DJ526_02345 [Sulfo